MAKAAYWTVTDGRWYAMLFQDSGAVGRIPVLVPVVWQDDFPVFGDDGHIPEKFFLKSTRPDYKYRSLVESDDFRGELKPCWQFNHEPELPLICHDMEHGEWRVTTKAVCSELTQAVNTITQRMLYPACAAEVTVNGEDVALTNKEFEILDLLLSRPGSVFTRDKIVGAVWGADFDGESRTLDVHIRTLRAKLGRCGELIRTVRGIGYKAEEAELK